MTESFTYPGKELVLFQHARHWKKYFSRQVDPYINGHVLEVGAGIGSTTALLNNGTTEKWLMLEPDAQLSAELQKKTRSGSLPANCLVQTGTIDQLGETFDTIIYIDVLEHIENDQAEIGKATALLNTGGHLIVLSPAFRFLYSPFDKEIGHFRRYNKKMLRKLTAPGLRLVSNRYYDSVGFFASLLNKLLFRQKYPSQKQIAFWDNWMVPVSTITDKIFLHSFGKAIIAVWKKDG